MGSRVCYQSYIHHFPTPKTLRDLGVKLALHDADSRDFLYMEVSKKNLPLPPKKTL